MKANDLVDLQQAARDSNWMRKGYLNKLFSAAEQQYILYAAQPGEMVWLLWSMKEAAYKIDNKFTGTRAFAPLKLNCRIIKIGADSCRGEVRVDGRVYYTASAVCPGDYIHSIATSLSQGLQLIRSNLLPNERGLDYKAMRPACVSHHGRYLALIF
jgi:phosphopantetheinyl transferase (holo-ACP synthase)